MKYIITSGICLIIGFILIFSNVYAHSGGTASDGCHYCRTNCDKYGVAWNQRHCHGGSSSSSYTPKPIPVSIPTPVPELDPISIKPKIPTCPPNSTYNSFFEKCACDDGYELMVNYCLKVEEEPEPTVIKEREPAEETLKIETYEIAVEDSEETSSGWGAIGGTALLGGGAFYIWKKTKGGLG